MFNFRTQGLKVSVARSVPLTKATRKCCRSGGFATHLSDVSIGVVRLQRAANRQSESPPYLFTKMASLPSPTQVAGNHYQIYEAYYQQVDPNNQGTIGALEAARFLKKSKLSDIVLGKIWDLSDPAGKGCLNKQGFFVALKLCALAQAGRGISMDNITADVPHPKMGEIPKIPSNKVMSSGMDWSIKPAEKAKYDQLFDSLQPTNGVISGNRVRGVLLESKLPLEMLGKIWDLADMDKDGSLNRHEFMIAMHLVYKALEKHTIPNVLPPELLPPGKRKDSNISQSNLIMTPPKPPVPPQPSMPPIPSVPPQPNRPPLPPQPLIQPSVAAPILSQPLVITQQPSAIPVMETNWVVSTEDKAKADALFHQTDADKDGYVSGLEIKDVFLQSGVPQPVLARIWSLCDTKQTGKLNNEQFALAMWLINQKVKGIDPPKVLTPEMVPPSLRSKQEGQTEVMPVIPTYSNPELEMIAADIRELTREKNTLETDIAQKEADIKIKSGEVKNLQSELDTLAATLKQLENQKGEAQKRLNDLKTQKSSIELELSDLVLEVEAEQLVVDKLRHQAEEQEESLRTQENELSSKKQELESLKQEEARLEKLQNDTKNVLDNLAKNLQDSQLQISQVKAKITQLEEVQRQMNDAIAICESATAANDPALVPNSSLSIGVDFRDPEITKLTIIDEEKDNTFSNMNGTAGFDDSAFPNDPFTSKNGTDGFGDQDPFGSAFGSVNKPASDGFADPFSAFGAPAANAGKVDPFDPFGDGSGRAGAKTPVDMSDKDPFGCDPFANLHAPERPTNPPARPESPSPALPPKKSKQPPPRPAPPRPMQPSRAAPVPPTPSPDPSSVSNDPFGGSGGFANFANFDSKLNKQETKSALGGIRAESTSPAHHPKSVSPVTSTTQGRYATFEFTEDPFKNYRYDDLFNIVDPFDEDNGNIEKTTNAGKTFKFESDDTAYEIPIGTADTESFESKFPKIDAFDAAFSFGSDPFESEISKEDKINGNTVNIFSDKKKNISDKNSNSINSDPFDVKKNEGTKLENRLAPDEFFAKGKCSTSLDKTLPAEEYQLCWAAQESLKMEEERLKQEAQEKADLEYAIAVSRKDINTLNRDKGRIRNLLRFGKNSPAT